MHATTHVLNALAAATDPTGATGIKFNAAGLIAWAQNNVIMLLLAFIALGMLARAKRAKFSENTGIIGNVFMALMVFVGGAAFVGLASGFVSLATS